MKEPENSWQVFYEETEEAQNVEKAEKIRQDQRRKKIPGYVPARERQQKDSRKNKQRNFRKNVRLCCLL